MPNGVAAGAATVNIVSSDGTQTAGNVQIAPVAPALFTLNGSQLAAAETITVAADGTQTYGSTYQTTSGIELAASPINVASGQVYLVLFGTGLDAANAANTKVTVNGVDSQVFYAGTQNLFTGLDQVNVLLPSSLAGKRQRGSAAYRQRRAANAVQIVIQ